MTPAPRLALHPSAAGPERTVAPPESPAPAESPPELPPDPASAPRQPPARQPLLVGADQAASLLGVSATFYRLRAAGKIGPSEVRLGGSVRWRLSELQEWVAAGCPGSKEWRSRRAAQHSGRPRG